SQFVAQGQRCSEDVVNQSSVITIRVVCGIGIATCLAFIVPFDRCCCKVWRAKDLLISPAELIDHSTDHFTAMFDEFFHVLCNSPGRLVVLFLNERVRSRLPLGPFTSVCFLASSIAVAVTCDLWIGSTAVLGAWFLICLGSLAVAIFCSYHVGSGLWVRET